MSLRALPLMVIPLILYNIVVVFAGGGPATGPLSATLFRLPMLSGATWTFTWGDLILLVTLVVLFAELVKATYTSTDLARRSRSVDAGVRRLPRRVPGGRTRRPRRCSSSSWSAAMIDVVAGFTIGIRVARRDLTIGAQT